MAARAVFGVELVAQVLFKQIQGSILSSKKIYLRRILQMLGLDVDTLKGKTVLNVGCGPAGMFILLNESNVTALDPLLDKYDQTLASFNKSDYPHTRFISRLVEEYSPTQKYDFIFAINMLDHVNNLTQTAMVLHSALKAEDGQLIVLVDSHRSRLLKLLMKIIPVNPLHPNSLSLEDYLKIFQNHNLTCTRQLIFAKKLFFDYQLLVFRKD